MITNKSYKDLKEYWDFQRKKRIQQRNGIWNGRSI